MVSRCRLGEFAGLVTPDTILRWYRDLIPSGRRSRLACCGSALPSQHRRDVSAPTRNIVCSDMRTGEPALHLARAAPEQECLARFDAMAAIGLPSRSPRRLSWLL